MNKSNQPHSSNELIIINKKIKIMGVSIYDKKEYEDYSRILKKKKNELSTIKYYEFSLKLYQSTISKNEMDLGYSVWCGFLEKYVWNYFLEKDMLTEDFNSDVEGVIDSKNMKLLIEHLNSVDIVDDLNNEIKNFIINKSNGIIYY